MTPLNKSDSSLADWKLYLECPRDEDRLCLSVALLDVNARPPAPRGDHLPVERLPAGHAVPQPWEGALFGAGGPLLDHASEVQGGAKKTLAWLQKSLINFCHS